jgi:hypothetical protein
MHLILSLKPLHGPGGLLLSLARSIRSGEYPQNILLTHDENLFAIDLDLVA